MAFDPNALFKLEDITDQFDPDDMKTNQGEAIATAIIFFIPAITKKGSPYLNFMANQSFAIFLLGFVVGIVQGILSFIPFIGGILGYLLIIGVSALSIANIVFAVIGKAKKLPVVGALNLEVFK